MAIKTYNKGTVTQLSTNFKSTEFDCHGSGCCSSTLIDENLVKYLQKIRDHFGKPLNISSGYRCAEHNKSVGGVTTSSHMKGKAADIYISGITPANIAKYAESIGILGIGLYETEKDGYFVHIDTRTTKSFWYGQAQAKRSTFGGSATAEKPDTSKVNTSAADPKKMWDYFKSKGMNDYGVAGVMGNLYAESALRACNLEQKYEKSLGMSDAEYTAAVDAGTYDNFVNDKAGYGLAQWTYWTLKRDMLAYHQKKGKSISDLDTQMEFLVHQLSTQFTSVWNVLTSAKSVREASDAMLLNFERPADQSVDAQKRRAAYGQKYYDSYATKEEIKIESPTPATKTYYRVRKAWSDAASQKGAYTILDNAKKKVDELGAGYYVFDENGKAIYPEVAEEPVAPTTSTGLKEGDAAKLVSDAKYISGKVIPTWVINSKVYIRDIRADGNVVFSTLQTGAVTGVTADKNLRPYTENDEIIPAPDAEIKKGNKVKLLKGATYISGATIPNWVFNQTLYAREIRSNGDIVISILQTGDITGVVNKKYLQLAEVTSLYSVKVTAGVLNIRKEASTSSAIVAQTKNGDVHEIYEVKGYWGRTRLGWIYLTYTKRI